METEIIKLVVSQDGQVEQKKIQLRAGKILLTGIRKEALSKTKNCLVLEMTPTMHSFLKIRQFMNLK